MVKAIEGLLDTEVGSGQGHWGSITFAYNPNTKRCFFIFQGGTGADDLCLRYTDDYGQTWSGRITIDGDIVGSYYGDFCIFYDDITDKVIVLYKDAADDLALKYSTDDGETWSGKVSIKAGTIPQHTGALLQFTATNESYIVTAYQDNARSYYDFVNKINLSDYSTYEQQLTNFRVFEARSMIQDLKYKNRVHYFFSYWNSSARRYENVYYIYTSDGENFYDINGNKLSLPIGTDTAKIYTATSYRVFSSTTKSDGTVFCVATNGDLFVLSLTSSTEYSVTRYAGAANVTDPNTNYSGTIARIFNINDEIYGLGILWDGSNASTKELYLAKLNESTHEFEIVTRITNNNVDDVMRNTSPPSYSGYWGIVSREDTSGANDYHYVLVTPAMIYKITLTDTVKVSDSLTKSVGLVRTDTVKVSDKRTLGVGIVRKDEVRILDTMAKGYGTILKDIVKVSDSIVKSIGINRTDRVKVSDRIKKDVSLIRQEVVRVLDSIKKRIGITRQDYVKVIDSIIKNIHLYRVEYVKVKDFLQVVKTVYMKRRGMLIILDDIIIDVVNQIIYVREKDVAV